MKAIVLVAGKGTRMAKDYEGPKHLLPVGEKTVLEYVLDSLPEEIEGIIMVVGGPHEDKIRDFFRSGEYGDKPIEFVVQEEQLGLAHAFGCAKELINGRWLGMVGDDIYDPKGMKALVQLDLALLSTKSDHPENFGVLVADGDDNLVKSVEKPKEFVSDRIWCGAMVMDNSFFDIDIPPSARGEYETSDVWMELIKQGKKIKIVDAGFWLPINDKAQLEEAARVLEKEGMI